MNINKKMNIWPQPDCPLEFLTIGTSDKETARMFVRILDSYKIESWVAGPVPGMKIHNMTVVVHTVEQKEFVKSLFLRIDPR